MDLALEPVFAIDYAEPRAAMLASLPSDRCVLCALRDALLAFVLLPCLFAAASLSFVLLIGLPR